MTLLLLCVLCPVLLFCALKLSLVEKSWEVLASAVVVSLVPVGLHRLVAASSLPDLADALRSPEVLQAFAALFALEALLGLILVASVMTVHAWCSELAAGRRMGRGRADYGAVLAAVAVAAVAGGVAGWRVLLALGLVLLTGVLLWPWLPWRVPGNKASWSAARRAGTQAGALLVTPAWALLSPAGIAATATMHMHLLRVVTGVSLWRVTLLYAVALFLGLTATALALKAVVRQWHVRLEGVLVLAFLLLVAAMFLPHLFTNTPPPASAVRVDWLATAAFLATTAVTAGGPVLLKRPRRRTASATVNGI